MRYTTGSAKHVSYSTVDYFGGCRCAEDRHRDNVCKTISAAFRLTCLLAFFTILIMAATALMSLC